MYFARSKNALCTIGEISTLDAFKVHIWLKVHSVLKEHFTLKVYFALKVHFELKVCLTLNGHLASPSIGGWVAWVNAFLQLSSAQLNWD